MPELPDRIAGAQDLTDPTRISGPRFLFRIPGQWKIYNRLGYSAMLRLRRRRATFFWIRR
jgi:hypothetical protein